MEHTPGPWKVETVPTAVGICHKIGPFEACIYVDNWNKGPNEMMSNAHLIAAAPDLLAACEEIVELIESGQAVRHTTRTLMAVTCRLAIEKAKGENQ